MIRLKVEWHHTCPECGVGLAIDFLDDPGDCRVCPWCGHTIEVDPRAEADGLKDDLARAAKELEEKANQKITAIR